MSSPPSGAATSPKAPAAGLLPAVARCTCRRPTLAFVLLSSARATCSRCDIEHPCLAFGLAVVTSALQHRPLVRWCQGGTEPVVPPPTERRWNVAQNKQYRAGMKKPAGGATVQSGSQQSKASGTQGGKTHAVKNRSVNHGRNR